MIIDLIFPKNCLGCRRAGGYICSACLGKLAKLKTICPVCERASIDGFTHVKCRRPYSLDGLTSMWPYQGILRKALIAMKYRFADEIARDLIQHATKYLKDCVSLKNLNSVVLVPIPTVRKRHNWRGFNQTEVMGKLLAKKLGWNYEPNLLIRKTMSLPQTGLRGKQRSKNVLGVFSIDSSTKLPTTNYSLLIFDDVWTTGSTLREAGKVIKRNGFNKVWGLTIAR